MHIADLIGAHFHDKYASLNGNAFLADRLQWVISALAQNAVLDSGARCWRTSSFAGWLPNNPHFHVRTVHMRLWRGGFEQGDTFTAPPLSGTLQDT